MRAGYNKGVRQMNKIIGRIENGTLTPQKWAEVKQAFTQYEGKTVELSIGNAEAGTDPQRKYWYGTVVAAYAKFMGETDTDSVHASLMGTLWPEEAKTVTNIFTGAKNYERVSWAKLGKEKRSQSIEKAIQYAFNSFMLTIPPPDKGEV
jgi:hypothetical protein